MSAARNSASVTAPKGADGVQKKMIIFIRHGESDWNYIFNKSKLLLLPRLVLGAIREVLKLFNNKDSIFIDSALSSEGVAQAKALQKFLQEYKRKSDTADDIHEAMKALRGDAGASPSVLVSSNLRRAIATGCIAMWPRQQRTKERAIVLSSLQEMSRNVDTSALAGASEYPEISVVAAATAQGSSLKAESVLDVSQSKGNKGFGRKALKSMEEFNAWCFQRSEPIIIVSAGHSLWFKNYFKVYIEQSIKTHHAKDLKMVNCGVVAFNLEKGVMTYDAHQTGYKVDAGSITSLYGGFEKQKTEPKRSSKLHLAPAKHVRINSGPVAHEDDNQKSSGLCCTGR